MMLFAGSGDLAQVRAPSTEMGAMAFVNEYVPKIEDEKSDYFLEQRQKLRLGFVPSDKWTVDRDRNMILRCTGRGREPESNDEEYWTFLSGDRKYRFMTKLLESRPLSKERIFLKRSIHFDGGSDISKPSSSVISDIRMALVVYKDYGAISRYGSCELLLVDHLGEAL